MFYIYVTIAVATALLFILKSRREDENLKKIPGPKTHPFFGNVLQCDHFNAMNDFTSWHATYGSIYKLYIFSTPLIAVNDAQLIREITMNRAFYRGKYPWELDIKALGKVLFAVDGDEWRIRRSRINHNFKISTVNQLLPTITERTEKLIELLKANQGVSVDLDLYFVNLTLDVIIKFLLSDHFHSLESNKYKLSETFATFGFYIFMCNSLPFWTYLPSPKFNQAKNHFRTVLHSFISNRIEEHQQMQENGQSIESKDILDSLLLAHMSVEEVKDELAGLIFAGHDTTAHTLSYAVYELMKHPEVYNKLMEEIDRVIPDESPSVTSMDQVNNLKYLNCVIKETLRLYPPATASALVNDQDYQLGDYLIPKNVIVLVNTYSLQRNPKYWEKPEEFMPERFLSNDTSMQIVDGIEGPVHQQALSFMPFLQGRHSCIGQHIAMLEARAVLATLLKNITFTEDPKYILMPMQQLTLRPANKNTVKDGMNVIPQLRKRLS